jgi:transcriptional regulator with XRE-family HTH domain
MRRALREMAGLSGAHIADQLGVTRQTISHYECGIRTPSGDLLEGYVAILEELRELVWEPQVPANPETTPETEASVRNRVMSRDLPAARDNAATLAASLGAPVGDEPRELP